MEKTTLPPRKGSATAAGSLQYSATYQQDVISNGGISEVDARAEGDFEDSSQSVGVHSRYNIFENDFPI